jgi:hypothetical protein
MIRKALLTVFCSSVCFAVACGGSDETSSAVTVAAEKGGTVELNNDWTLEIPPKALTKDTEIVLTVAKAADYPKLDDVAKVLRIEPEGTVLGSMATLKITQAKAQDQIVKVHQLIDGAWKLASSPEIKKSDLEVVISQLGPIAVTVKTIKDTPANGNRIVGTAVWRNESPAAKLPIELWKGESKLTSTTTDAEGAFSFIDLSPGDYEVVLTSAAECPAKHPVKVTAQAPTKLDIVVCGAR